MNVVQRHLESGVAAHQAGRLDEAERIYQAILNLDPGNPTILYLLGDIAVRRGHNGLAINLLSNSAAIDPKPSVFETLGCAYKAEQLNKEAEDAWRKALEFGETSALYSNLSTIYADSCEPEKALPLCERAIELDPENPHAHWNRALALLTQARWAEGWEEHEWRLRREVSKGISQRDYGAPRWEGQPGGTVVVHGEQGVGDEIMFLSCLHEVTCRAKRVIVEVEPRLIEIVERSFPGVWAYGNEAALKAHEEGYDYCIPLGSLPRLFRQSGDTFPQRPYLYADPYVVKAWGENFDRAELSRPRIGLAWVGGTKKTRVQHRSIEAADLKWLQDFGTVVSLQYGEHAEMLAKQAGFHFFSASDGKDIDELAGMVMACDVIVTVCQTLVHLCGALGKKCWVLTPFRASWRYGQTDRMPWYGSVELIRQKTPDDWSGPIEELKRRFGQEEWK